MKVTCIICGYKTLDSRCNWDICPVCFWEDDVVIDEADSDPTSPANGGLQVSKAQANFMRHGYCEKRCKEFVRKPLHTDELDPSWHPLPKAINLVGKPKLK